MIRKGLWMLGFLWLSVAAAQAGAPASKTAPPVRGTPAQPVQTVSPAQDPWQWRNPLPQSIGLRSLCFAKGIFVAAGYSGAILSSRDGQTWTRRTPSDTEGLLSLACSDAGFVAAGYNYGSHRHAALYHSSDGEQWSTVPWPAVPDLADVVFADSRFIGIAYTGSGVCQSKDGRVWTCTNLPVPGPRLDRLVYGNGTLVAAAANKPGSLFCSSDAKTWGEQATGLTERITGLAFGNGLFVAADQSGALAHSSDGRQWSRAGALPGGPAQKLRFVNGRFIALADQPYLSSDGRTWSAAQPPKPPSLADVAFGLDRYVAPAGAAGCLGCRPLYTSPDAQTWTPAGEGETLALRAVAFGPAGFVAAGQAGQILTSPDGVAWTRRGQPDFRVGIKSLSRGPEAWVAVGTPYFVARSGDGQTWETIALPAALKDPANQWGGFTAVVYGNGRYVAVGEGGLIGVSADGRSWSRSDAGTRLPLAGIAFGNGVFAALARDGGGTAVLTSRDGAAWSLQRVTDFGYPDRIGFGNSTFVILNAGMTLTSTDASGWTKRPRPASANLKVMGSLDFVNGQFVATGVENRLIVSPDGITWTRGAATPVFGNLYGVAYGGGQYVAVGEGGAILTAAKLAP